MVGVGGGGVVRAAVQRLLGLCGAADVATVQTAGVLQYRGVETHLMELVGGGHRLPGVRWFVVRVEPRHTRLWWCTDKKKLLYLCETHLDR